MNEPRDSKPPKITHELVKRNRIETPILNEALTRLFDLERQQSDKREEAIEHHGRGMRYEHEKNYIKAKEEYEAAVALWPKDDYLEHLGKILYKLGDYQRAIPYLEKSAERWTGGPFVAHRKELERLLARARKAVLRRAKHSWWKRLTTHRRRSTSVVIEATAIETLFGTLGKALISTGYSTKQAITMFDTNLTAECIGCGTKISGASISLAQSSQLLERAVFTGNSGLALGRLRENQCVIPTCLSKRYRVLWADEKTKPVVERAITTRIHGS